MPPDPAPTALPDVIAWTLNQATRDDLDRLMGAVKQRRRILGQITAAAVTVKARVKLTGLSPRYLNDRTGTVTAINGERGDVDLDEEILARGRLFGQKTVRGVPLQCLQLID
jgi:hypothetical protein